MFSISNLEDLIFHYQVCLQREEKDDFTKNKRVGQSNNLHENENEKYNKAAINQGLSLEALELKIESQAKDIALLLQFFRSQTKQTNNLMVVVIFVCMTCVSHLHINVFC